MVFCGLELSKLFSKQQQPILSLNLDKMTDNSKCSPLFTQDDFPGLRFHLGQMRHARAWQINTVDWFSSREKKSRHAGGLISVTARTEESDLRGGLQSLW